MIANIIKGTVIGISNIIPGVSGGTTLVLLGVFDKTMKSVSIIFNFKDKVSKKEEIIFLLQLGFGIGIGIIGFAKIISYLFEYYPTQTMWWFIGLIFFSIPIIIDTEIKKIKFSNLFFSIGILIIIMLLILNPAKSNSIINTFPDITFNHLIMMFMLGFIGGITTVVPGISGSMVLLILGKYYLIQSYLAHSTELQINILIPIFSFGLGAILGVIIGAKVIAYFLNKYRGYIMSLILGLIVMSIIAIIPINTAYTLKTIISSLITFLLGGLLIELTKKRLK